MFLKAYRAIRRFRGDSSFSTWLYRIAVNTCLNFRSARKPQTEELPEALADPRAGVVASLESDERACRVRDAIRRLPEKQRATLILKVYHDLTHEEVAEIIGTTRETVSRLFSEFKKKQLMQLKGATLVIRSRMALEKIVQS